MKKTWNMHYFFEIGCRQVKIVRYSNPEKLLEQIFGGSAPPDYTVTMNTSTRIELAFDGKPDIYLVPV